MKESQRNRVIAFIPIWGITEGALRKPGLHNHARNITAYETRGASAAQLDRGGGREHRGLPGLPMTTEAQDRDILLSNGNGAFYLGDCVLFLRLANGFVTPLSVQRHLLLVLLRMNRRKECDWWGAICSTGSQNMSEHSQLERISNTYYPTRSSNRCSSDNPA